LLFSRKPSRDRAADRDIGRTTSGELACVWQGLEPNRPTWEAIGRFVHEQSLAPRIVTPEELFPVKVE
jgi:hypothetical protein